MSPVKWEYGIPQYKKWRVPIPLVPPLSRLTRKAPDITPRSEPPVRGILIQGVMSANRPDHQTPPSVITAKQRKRHCIYNWIPEEMRNRGEPLIICMVCQLDSDKV